MAFVLDWKAKLGYRDDPFSERPAAPVADYFVDREHEREALNLFIIKQGRFGILQGAKGSGKSTLLAWLTAELEQHQKALRVLRLDDEKLLADKHAFALALLDSHLSLFERTVTKPHQTKKPEEREALLIEKLGTKRLVLLIDNAGELAKENQQLLVRLLAACSGLQVILALERVLKEHEAMGDDALTIALEEMDDASLEELLTRRIALVSDHAPFPFDDPEMRKLIASAKRSPAKLLSLAHDRAIELSLKVTTPPKAEKRSAKKAETKDGAKADAKAEAMSEKKEEKLEKAEDEKLAQKHAQGELEASALLLESAQDIPAPQQKKKWFSIKFAKDEDDDAAPAQESARSDAPLANAKKEEYIDSELLDKVLADATKAQDEKQDAKSAQKRQEAVKRAADADGEEKKLARSGIIKGGRRR